jgi:hypothetical protein
MTAATETKVRMSAVVTEDPWIEVLNASAIRRAEKADREPPTVLPGERCLRCAVIVKRGWRRPSQETKGDRS